MKKYTKPIVQTFTKNDVKKRIANAASCTVVCTYMYGYCGQKDGWGTTHCPTWGYYFILIII